MKPTPPRLLIAALLLWLSNSYAQTKSFSLADIKQYPFPTELTAAFTQPLIAWAVDEKGLRNVYMATAPDWKPQRLTHFTNDDGQEISAVSVSGDGKWICFVRGGDHGANWDDEKPVNPANDLQPQKMQVFTVASTGGNCKAIAEGDDPVLSPAGDSIAFIKDHQVWMASTDGTVAAHNLFTTQGNSSSLQFSPDGSALAFVSQRGDHSIIGVYRFASKSIEWVSPAFKKDASPRWRPDGKKLVFIRQSGSGTNTDSLLARKPVPWSICVAAPGDAAAQTIYTSPNTLEGSVPSTHGGFNLHWAAGNKICFLSYADGWPHLYSVDADGGTAMLLTPGKFMAEHIRLSPDGNWLYFAANAGPDALDIDRRHVCRAAVNKPGVEVLTPGTGNEWSPVVVGSNIALISATAQRPPLPAILPSTEKKWRLLGEEMIPASYPTSLLVTPKQVVFTSPDGVEVHAQLFVPTNGAAKNPAVVYIHGGPMRQMLLGWHYSDYYANGYATNQYLASLGFVVLSVNYRLGIGYGFNFHQPPLSGRYGAAEYQDIKAAAEWLQKQSMVDANRIGVYGGSYGGYLTAMALAKDSKLFAAGVDVHGVHDWSTIGWLPEQNSGYEKIPDLDKAIEVAYRSSPVAYLQGWTSPVLIIHGDDDRNVPLNQSTDLVRRLEKLHVPMETKLVVGDTHHWMKYSNALALDQAIADFFIQKLKGK